MWLLNSDRWLRTPNQTQMVPEPIGMPTWKLVEHLMSEQRRMSEKGQRHEVCYVLLG